MLSVTTDIKDTRWLSYILEEFSRINNAEFSIQVVSQKGSHSFSHEITYSKSPSQSPSVPNMFHIQPGGKIKKMSNDIFIIDGTEVEDRLFICAYDIFWNAFIFLSRLEEYQSEAGGKEIQSHSFKHPRKDKTIFDVPVVNHLFDELEKIIKTNFPKLPFGQKQDPIIEYSHDVDYIQKTLQLRLKQTVFNGFNTFKSIFKPVIFAKQMKKTISFFISNPSYWCFDYWEELEKKANIRSVFYVYAKTEKKKLKSWLLDPSYDIATNINLQRRLRHLIYEGFEVGLHGSFYSATDGKMLSKEKTVLEESIGIEVDKVRQHWLRYEEGITPYLHNELFKYDSTLGWNDRMGFRSGIAGRYRPYDHKNRQAFGYMVTPQVIMDANIYDYGVKEAEELEKKAIRMLESLRQLKSVHISISWHQRVRSSDYGWHALYEQILIQEGHKVGQHGHIVN